MACWDQEAKRGILLPMVSRRSLRNLSAAALFCGSMGVGCSIIYSWDGYVPTSGASLDGGGDAGISNAQKCGVFEVPAPPQSAQATPELEFNFAINDLIIDPADDAKATLGIDLDNRCTCAAGCSCVCTCPSTPSCRGNLVEACDLRGGVDNSGGKFLQTVFTLANSGKTQAEMLATGSSTIAFTVRGYNGLPNDSSVSVQVFRVNGLNARPKWDGSDRRVKDALTFSPAGIANILGTGYVRDGYLVTEVTGSLPFEDLSIPFSTLRIIAKLSNVQAIATPPKLEVTEGFLAGRIPVKSLFTNLKTLKAPSDPDAGACADPSYKALVVDAICKTRDIMTSAAEDGQDKDCNAVALSWRFRAKPVALEATPVQAKPPPTPFACADVSCE
jgi:hypothetical protein